MHYMYNKTARDQQEMAKNAVQFSELLECIGTTKNDMEWDSSEARITAGWE